MIEATERGYINAILKKFEADIDSGKAMYLFDSKATTIRKACIRLYEEGNIDLQDKRNIYRFFDIKKEENAIQSIENYTDGMLKSVSIFLRKKTKPKKTGTVELIAWLVDFNPRPLSNYLKSKFEGCEVKDKEFSVLESEEIIQAEKTNHFFEESVTQNIEIKQKPKSKKPYLFLGLIALGLLFSIWWFNKKEFNPIEIEEPQLQDTLVINEEEIKPIVEDKALESKTIIENKVEIAIFNNTELDIEITQILQKRLFKNKISSIFKTYSLNTQKVKNLQAGNFSTLINSKPNKASQYCFGKVSYKYQTSKVNSMMQVCFLNVTYSTYSLQGNLLNNLSKTKRITANGFTNDEAKYNALKKLEQL